MPYEKFKTNIINLSLKEGLKKIAIAVSGGADSIALLYLASALAKEIPLHITAINVNHGLRSQANAEGEYVKEVCQSLGHSYAGLAWDHQNNFSNLQARARQGRYELMTCFCKQQGILTLLTAHHQNDYIENFCIRNERKSGIFGLSSSNIHFINNIMILRPLFNVFKRELTEYLISNNIKWLEDESNTALKYQRNRIRYNIKLLGSELAEFEQQILLKQSVINDQAKQLRLTLIKAIAESVEIDNFGIAKINLNHYANFPSAIKTQLISHLLTIVSGQQKTPGFDGINAISTLISCKKSFTRTLHGCFIKKINDIILIYREFGKTQPASVLLTAEGVIWDNRFRLSCLRAKNYYVSNLTRQEYNEIKPGLNLKLLKTLSLNNHHAILFTLPVIKLLEKIVAIPHISYYDETDLKGKLEFTFHPGFISRFTHFC